MNWILPKIRKIVFAASAIWALAVFGYIANHFGTNDLIKIRLVQAYAFTAESLLYLALLISPLYVAFPNLPGKIILVKARKAIGVSAFFFALLHGSLAFFGTLGGFAGLSFLSGKFLLAIILSTIALLFLAIMAATSLGWLVKKLRIPWKPIHRIVYITAVLILIHALMLGTHYINLHSFTAVLTFVLAALLLLLEMNRLDAYLDSRAMGLPKYGLITVAALVVLGLFAFRVYGPQNSSGTSLGIHAGHLAQLNQNSNTSGVGSSIGKKYTLSVSQNSFEPNVASSLIITIYDADTGAPVTNFDRVHDKLMHLVISDNSLTYYDHLHPEFNSGAFSVPVRLPSNGQYRFYFQFMPSGGTEQTFGMTAVVGKNIPSVTSTQLVDTSPVKTVASTTVSLATSDGQQLSIEKVKNGAQNLVFHLVDSATGQPVTNIEPYLGAFGHLVLIKQDTYQYVHVHPLDAITSGLGGPDVRFAPLAFANFQPLEPGTYRAFVQFQRDAKIITVDFTIKLAP